MFSGRMASASPTFEALLRPNKPCVEAFLRPSWPHPDLPEQVPEKRIERLSALERGFDPFRRQLAPDGTILAAHGI